MSFTFVSNSGSAIPAGTVILWYGTKAAIPAGWSYYAETAGMWVKGATSVSTNPQNNATHSHTYSADTGAGGSHGHTYTSPVIGYTGISADGFYSGANFNTAWAREDHTGHSASISVVPNNGHVHDVLTTGNQAIIPPSVGVYYIKKAG